MAEQPEERIGPYRLCQTLGRGAMGIVYLAHEDSLNRDVALKVLSPDLASHATYVERFRREAQAAAGLRHPNIVQIYALSESGQVPHFAMEYIEGRDLKETLIQEGAQSWRTSLEIVLQIAKALDVAHGKGVVHRDIKPGNVMVERNSGRVVVTDFGLSRVLAGSRLTRDGEVFGTPEYMSPEQIDAKDVDGRADLYSLGVVFFELLTGAVPFEAESPLAVLRKHVETPPPLSCDINPSVPEEVAQICDRLLEKEPKDRVQSAAELIRCLNDLLVVGSETVLTLGTKRKPRAKVDRPALGPRALWAAAGGFLVLLGVVVGVFVSVQMRPKTAPDPSRSQTIAFDKAYASAKRLQAQGNLLNAVAKYWAIATLCEEEDGKRLATAGARECLETLIESSELTLPKLIMDSGLFTSRELAAIQEKGQSGDLEGAVRMAVNGLVAKGLLSEAEGKELSKGKGLALPDRWRAKKASGREKLKKLRAPKVEPTALPEPQP